MLALAATVAAATATTAAWALARRRRAHRGGLLGPLPLGAGLHHLASGVSELSDLGLHLHASGRAAKPRLGAVLEQR